MTARGSVIYLDDVTVSFDGFQALRGLNFFLEYGEVHALIGPNGAGKSTLLDVICGRVKPQGGRVIFGRMTDLARLMPHEIAEVGIGRKFQTPSVFKSLTVYENLGLAVRRKRTVFSGLRGGGGDQAEHRIAETLELLGLSSKAEVRAGFLSHGEMQWLEMGMVMVQEPQVFLLDEPVAGMTGKERERTGELIRWMARDRAVLVVEHDMEFVRMTAAKVTVLHEGLILCQGSVEEVQGDPRVIEVYLGRESGTDAQN